MAERKWIIGDDRVSSGSVQKIMDETGCQSLLASVIASRSVDNPLYVNEIFNHEDGFCDPYLLPDMELALNRLKLAKSREEKVTVYGDYDADGVTGTVIMCEALSEYGLNVDKFIPNRIIDGYGMNENSVHKLYEGGTKLIVTVDCGIACKGEIELAKQLGMDTIVTDHHECPKELPDCCAVVNPKRSDSRYPFSLLAGAGVAYKLACALLKKDYLREYIGLAAIGTVADVVSLTGENRKIVKEGLDKLTLEPRVGTKALLSAITKESTINATTISFMLAPRINCAGRMKDAQTAYSLLTAENTEVAFELANELCALNKKRQQEEQRIYKEAVEIIKEKRLYEDDVIVVGAEGWNPGVVGISASRITELVYKPCILISYDEEGNGRASGRSIDGFNLYDALCAVGETLTKFGGHALAVGLSLKKKNEEQFRRAINDYAKDKTTKELQVKTVYVDSKVEPSEITVRAIEELSKLEPCGVDNSKPVFAYVNAKITDMKTLSEGRHLKLMLTKDNYALDAIGFGFGGAAKKLYKGMVVHAAGTLNINDYNGKPQLIIKDILI